MKARDNPFAPARLARILGFDPALNGTSWEALDAGWEKLGCRAAITGHHGAGKSSLLDAWARRMTEPPLRLFFNDERCRLQKQDREVLAGCAGKIVLVDGEEHLPWRERRELRKGLFDAKGVLLARHRRGPWQELIRLSPDPQIAAVLLERAVPEFAGRFGAEIDPRFRRRKGNLRELWFDLYDEISVLR